MKKTFRFLSMAALALVGAMMTGCSNDDSIIDNPQQPENKDNVVTLTTTVGLDGGAATRALDASGHKTFATGDEMAVIYKNLSGETVKAVGTLTSGANTASGTFTFTLSSPDKTQNVTYIYPAAMAGTTGVDYSKLNSQTGGTLDDLGSKYDLCTKSGAWNGDNLPSLTLENQLAILAITLKNEGGGSLSAPITGLTINDGTNNYAVSGILSASTIYVAIRPTSSATINVTATDGANGYIKTLTGKTYAANKGYNVTWRMAANTLANAITASDKGKVIGANGIVYDNATAASTAGTTAVAMIVYVGAAGSADDSSPVYKGLALALADASTNATWCDQYTVSCLPWYSPNDTYAKADMDGIVNTNMLVGSSHDHVAAKAARDYKYVSTADAGAHPTGTSAWFLPSAGQWNKMLEAGYLGAGYAGLANTGYWTSTEYNEAYAWRFVFNATYPFENDTSSSYTNNKVAFTNNRVRACIAF